MFIIWLPDHADENCSQMLKGMDLKEKRLKEGNTLLELEPAAVQVLHELVSLVHNSVSASQDQQSLSTSINDYDLIGSDKYEKIATSELKDDPVAKILWNVKPQTLQNVFLSMAVSFHFPYNLQMSEKLFLCTSLYCEPCCGCFRYKLWFNKVIVDIRHLYLIISMEFFLASWQIHFILFFLIFSVIFHVTLFQ